MTDFIASAQRAIQIETKAIEALGKRINGHFSSACELMLNCTGRVIVTGIGKSGHIANKIAATLASTGTPAFFLHAAEASHGDLGMITNHDVIIAISGSGKTEEIVSLIPAIKRIGAPLISLVGNLSSPLALQSDIALDTSVAEEACPLDLAPTSSTTVTLVMGDAIAVALLEARGFTAEDFAVSHPGGTLGKRLLVKVEDAMVEDFPKVALQTTVAESLLEISRAGVGMTTVTDTSGNLLGVFTDGDLRRCMAQDSNPGDKTMDEVMTRQCKTVSQHALAAEALKIMQDSSISSLVVIDKDNKLSGVIHLHELIRMGLA